MITYITIGNESNTIKLCANYNQENNKYSNFVLKVGEVSVNNENNQLWGVLINTLKSFSKNSVATDVETGPLVLDIEQMKDVIKVLTMGEQLGWNIL